MVRAMKHGTQSVLLCRQTASGDNLAQMMDRSVPGAFW